MSHTTAPTDAIATRSIPAKKTLLGLSSALLMVGLSLAGPASAAAVAHVDGTPPQQPTAVIAAVAPDDDRRPGDLKSADDHRVEAVSPYTEYCIKKYPFDPEKAYECSLGWVVD